MNYPNMSPELFEAIHEFFKDDPEVEADVYLFLTAMAGNLSLASKVSMQAKTALAQMNRCERCGTPLEVYHYQEPHDELDGCPMEDMYEPYCPNCDTPHQMRMKGV